MAAVSARRMRGPSETGRTNRSRSSTARSRGPNPPSGPTSNAAGPVAGAQGLRVARSSATNSGRFAGPGGQNLVQRPGRADHRNRQPLALLRRLDRDGAQPVLVDPSGVGPFGEHRQQRRDPSSVAFCTTRSVVSRFSTANTSHRSASGACGRTQGLGREHRLAARQGGDPRRPFAVAAVEQAHASPIAAAHDAAEVMRLSRARLDRRAGRQAAFDDADGSCWRHVGSVDGTMERRTNLSPCTPTSSPPAGSPGCRAPGCPTCFWRVWTGRSAHGCCSCPGCGASCWRGPPLPETIRLVVLFAIGSLAMRAAGCVVNDLWDRDIDRKVARTAGRPLASGALRPRQALVFLARAAAGRAGGAAAAQSPGAGAGGRVAAAGRAVSAGQARHLVAATDDGLHLRLWRADGLRRRLRPARCRLGRAVRRGDPVGPGLRHDLRASGPRGRRAGRRPLHRPPVRRAHPAIPGGLLRRRGRRSGSGGLAGRVWACGSTRRWRCRRRCWPGRSSPWTSTIRPAACGCSAPTGRSGWPSALAILAGWL